MTQAEQIQAVPFQVFITETKWLRDSVGPFLVAAIAVILLGVLLVFSSRNSWELLGLGHGLVAEESYQYTGLFIVLATTFGQFVGWAAGSALLAYFLCQMAGMPVTIRLIQFSMTVVYLGVCTLPLYVYHILYGRMEPHLSEWLLQNNRDAYGLLFAGHFYIDWSVVPLAVAVLVIIWGCGERALRRRGLQIILLFLILATSLAVSMSLALHSTLTHIRIGM